MKSTPEKLKSVYLFLGIVPDMGSPAGEGDDSFVRSYNSRRGG